MRVAVVGHVEWIEFGRVDHVPAAGEIVHVRESWEVPGGGGAVAAVQLCRLAGAGTLYTALGDDELGHRSKDELERLGLRVEAVFRPETQRRAFVHLGRARGRTLPPFCARATPARCARRAGPGRWWARPAAWRCWPRPAWSSTHWWRARATRASDTSR